MVNYFATIFLKKSIKELRLKKTKNNAREMKVILLISYMYGFSQSAPLVRKGMLKARGPRRCPTAVHRPVQN